LAYVKGSPVEVKPKLDLDKLPFEKQAIEKLTDSAARFPVAKSLQILELVFRKGNRKTVYSARIGQTDLACTLHITRQALNQHLKKLRESGLAQVGRGFINVTEDGLRALGYRKDPVIITVRVSPQRRSDAFEKMKSLPAIEIFRVAGDADVVLIVEQHTLEQVLETLSEIDGIVETKSLVAM